MMDMTIMEKRRPKIWDAGDFSGDEKEERGRTVADKGAACHGAEVGDDLGYGYGVWGEVVLVFKHCWVEILRAMRLGMVSGGIL